MAGEKVGKPNPWGKNNEAVDMERRKEQEAVDEKSKKIANYTEHLKKRIQNGTEADAESALDDVLAPVIKNDFPEYHVRKNFVAIILHEVEKKYGEDSKIVSRLDDRLDRFVIETWDL